MSAILLVLLLVAPDPSPEPMTPGEVDLKNLQGDWKILKAERDGKPGGNEIVGKIMTFKKDTVSVNEGPAPMPISIKLDGKKNPREFNLLPPGSEKPVLGIYKLEGDQLTMCFSQPGQARPTTFNGKTAALVVLERMKK